MSEINVKQKLNNVSDYIYCNFFVVKTNNNSNNNNNNSLFFSNVGAILYGGDIDKCEGDIDLGDLTSYMYLAVNIQC
jgi:hypothetical protein